jgi:hypothetical protein
LYSIGYLKLTRVFAFGGAILIGLVAWSSSPYLHFRTTAIWTEIQKYEATTRERHQVRGPPL